MVGRTPNKIIKDFFYDISVDCGYGIGVVQKVYFSLLRVVLKRLMSGKEVLMPQWGKYNIILYKSRKNRDINTRKLEVLSQKAIIKFYPLKKLKKYIMGNHINN